MCDQLRYGKDISFLNPMDPEALKINKTGMAHSSTVPAGLSKTVCADKLSFMREAPNNPSPGE